MPLPKSILCTQCKKTYPEGWQRCPYCGHDSLRAKQDAQARRYMQKKVQDFEQRTGRKSVEERSGRQPRTDQRPPREGRPGRQQRPERGRGQRPPAAHDRAAEGIQRPPAAAPGEGGGGGGRRRRRRRGGNRERAVTSDQQQPQRASQGESRPGQAPRRSQRPRGEATPAAPRSEAAGSVSGQTPKSAPRPEGEGPSRRRRFRRRRRGGGGGGGRPDGSSTPQT